MRKVRFFLTLAAVICLAFPQDVLAQPYTPVTTLSGIQVTGGITVNVTPINSPSSANLCGTGPYQIGKLQKDGYRYEFQSGDITHVRLSMIRIHDDDTIRILVNGPNDPGDTYTLTGGNLNAYPGTCTPAYTSNVTTTGGLLSTTSGAVGPGQAVEIEIQLTPNTISEISVIHDRHPNNNIASDVIYSMEIADDSCSLGFTATIDSPVCTKRNIQLDVTDFPNTTYSWTWNTPLTPTFAPSPNVRNPVLQNVNQGHSGQYIVTGTRGTGPNACEYKDTLNVNVLQTPDLGQPLQSGPVCPHDKDTIKVPLVNLPTGGWVVAYGAWGRDTFDASQGYILAFDDVLPTQAGVYNIYAVGTQGCISDTNSFPFQVYDSVDADFGFSISEDCLSDTVAFIDQSTSGGQPLINFQWRFGDGSPISTDKDPVHPYPVLQKDEVRTYNVRHIASNGFCADTVEKDVVISHPIRAFFRIPDDSICQGTLVEFLDAEDSSFVKAGTNPTIEWYYGDGSSDLTNSFTADYTYNVSGVYYPKLVITDFLGCSDTFEVEVVVDSIGFVTFTTDKESVCVGDQIKFTGDYSEYGLTSAIWDLGNGVQVPDSFELLQSYLEPGTYDITFDVTYRICPDETYTGQLEVRPIPDVYLGEDTAICPAGEPIFIQNIATSTNPGNITYSWNTPTADVTPGIYVRHQGMYAVTAELEGCTAKDTVFVKKNCYINIPNAFTPNGDGNGDYFLPRQMLSRNVTEFEMHIYNRWGEEVFQSDATNGRGWDGRYGGEAQPMGVYIYTINVTFGNGYTERYQGNVTLLR